MYQVRPAIGHGEGTNFARAFLGRLVLGLLLHSKLPMWGGGKNFPWCLLLAGVVRVLCKPCRSLRNPLKVLPRVLPVNIIEAQSVLIRHLDILGRGVGLQGEDQSGGEGRA